MEVNYDGAAKLYIDEVTLTKKELRPKSDKHQCF